MRNITTQSVIAFNQNQKFSSGNTMVAIGDGWTYLLLHGHTIAGKNEQGFFIDSCGWKTNTTKDRLNALNGVSIQQKNGEWYLNGKLWDGRKIYL